MNYADMWYELKAYIMENKDYYAKGSMCSISEAIHGEAICDEIYKHMNNMEKQSRTNSECGG